MKRIIAIYTILLCSANCIGQTYKFQYVEIDNNGEYIELKTDVEVNKCEDYVIFTTPTDTVIYYLISFERNSTNGTKMESYKGRNLMGQSEVEFRLYFRKAYDSCLIIEDDLKGNYTYTNLYQLPK